MIPPTYDVFKKFTSWCRSKIPRELAQALIETKFDDENVKKLVVKVRMSWSHSVESRVADCMPACGVPQHGIEVCKKLLSSGSRFLHFFTMNLEISACAILEGLGLLPRTGALRDMPWRSAPPRPKEEVRPIFWVNRSLSYLARTAGWDEFPNGR